MTNKKLGLMAVSIMIIASNNIRAMDRGKYHNELEWAVGSMDVARVRSILSADHSKAGDSAKSVLRLACMKNNEEIRTIVLSKINERDRKIFFDSLVNEYETSVVSKKTPGTYITIPWLKCTICELHASDPRTYPLGNDIRLQLFGSKQ